MIQIILACASIEAFLITFANDQLEEGNYFNESGFTGFN